MLTDQEILMRLAAHEDSFVERKTVNDIRDCLKTVVAFANTAPVGYPAILFIGVRDNGDIEHIPDPDRIQRSLSERLTYAYPSIYTLTRVLHRDGKQFLAVIVPGSELRPHFAGQAFIRDGSQSIRASEAQFDKLIAERHSKAYEILKWKGKAVTLRVSEREIQEGPRGEFALGYKRSVRVHDCNQFYVTVENMQEANDFRSYSLEFVAVSFDNREARLELKIIE